MQMQSGLEVCAPAYCEGWKPEPRLSVSEWADMHRRLGTRAGRSAARWRTDVVPYTREIMDALSPRSPYHRVVMMAGTQLAKTETGNNFVGYCMDQAPGAILLLRPTVDEARRFSRQRLDAMIEATPVLSSVVVEPRSRKGSNSALIKEFPGGILLLAGSNSATSMKSMPIRYLFCDEIDEYPGDVDGQGDPIALAEKRTNGPSFARRKIYLVSTPTIKGISRIEREFLNSDQRRYFVPCPHCGNYDWMRWENIRYENDDPTTAALICVGCGGLIDERYKTQMLAQGEWRPTAEGDGETVGFHVSSLYSPLGWLPWSKIVAEFLKSKHDPVRLKTWINTMLGETWEERGDSVEPDSVLARREKYAAQVPEGVGVLVASVDVQDDRLECAVKGYGAAEESWLIAYQPFWGDPSTNEVWLELDAFLQQTFTHESGTPIQITCTTVDSGGHHTEQVYKFCKARADRRVFAIRGNAERGKPLVSRPSDRNRYRAKLFNLCVDTGKEIVYSRLRIGVPGPGYCHMPEWIDDEYVAQLTAEKAVRKWKKNQGSVREWVKLRERNEALDLEVYCVAALYILGPAFIRTLPERAAALSRQGEEDGEQSETREAVVPRRPGWVEGWRGN